MLPKFKFESPLPLKDVLTSLGVQSAFSRRADFSALSDRAIYVSDAVHKAVIEVHTVLFAVYTIYAQILW